MSQPFDQYATVRVAKLRADAAAMTAEADALEKALRAYRAESDAARAAIPPPPPLPPPLPPLPSFAQGSFQLPPKRHGRQIEPGSTTYRLLRFLDGAGRHGLTVPELYELFAKDGYTNQAAIRGSIFHQKKLERIKPKGNRYFAAAHAPP